MEEGKVSETRDKRPRLLSQLQEHRNWLMVLGAVVVVAMIGFSNAGSSPGPVKHAPAAPIEQKPIDQTVLRNYALELQKTTKDLMATRERDEAQRAAVQAAAQPGGGPVFQQTPQYASQPAGANVASAVRHESNVAVSFRPGSQQNATATPMDPGMFAQEKKDLDQLIQQQKDALRTSIDSAAKPAAPPPQPALSYSAKPAAPVAPELHEAIGKRYRVFEGSLIETVLENRLNGTFTGPVNVMVTNEVYSHDYQHVLIPKGTEILGEAQQVGQQGQKRLAVSFHRMLMPDGFSVDLDRFGGLNQIGETGLKDKVDNHYLQVFGTSIALGLVSGFSSFGTGSALTTSGIGQYRQGVAASVGQSSAQVLDTRLNILPTVTIREGHRVRVLLRQDLEIPAYENHRVPGDI